MVVKSRFTKKGHLPPLPPLAAVFQPARSGVNAGLDGWSFVLSSFDPKVSQTRW